MAGAIAGGGARRGLAGSGLERRGVKASSEG